ncbi:MAG: hypothetical protein COW01_15265 [Bdellovibrionales bacterium CG12_big_fil_rev_8_21_14_0_65_38_15]|nr:MAG: hypothetical protein COW79_15575 [Bdellovibrionales bacterium CG22_combo_CG10-13_8_21_14_all_38_13]PIQ52722.1 MAG: hypothetical protein COW01_15265 [Bdellovibrionales bacterium CG12_big_fil_rev_8_21_14_0_65_38_15]PIR31088.1 MAG: hypothetical protein COV38_02360 [Bdellovibrionales bacterium CG11_big_fil_rev_8_21_14_0_20_38_13]
MTFIKLNYSIYIFSLIFIIGVMYYFDYKKYRYWLRDCFNLKPTLSLFISKFLFIIAVLLFAISLLDLRGPHEQVSTPLSDQKTVILIDASSSMLVEDVQPNRFKRALTVARHFVKNAVGHQISVVVFSDISKRLIPFTDDIDLLDARLAGLEDERLRGGGSNITSALSETVKSLKLESSNGKPGGNILLITDAEENGMDFKIEESTGISLALVGIGTVSGGKIPMRTKRGTFSGYKTHLNKEVVSKLDEKFLDRIVSNFKRARKWIVLSFSMPTEDILTFFREGTISTSEIDQTKIRPVLSQWFVGAGIVLYLLSVAFSNARSYSTLIVILMISSLNFQSVKAEQSKEEVEQANQELLNDLSQDWSTEQKQQAALELAKKNQLEKAMLLYKEAEGDLSIKAKANYGATLLANGDQKGLKVLDEVLKENASKDIELERLIHSNIKKFLSVNGGKGDGESKDENKEENQDKKSGSGNSKDQKNDKNQTGDQEKNKDDKKSESDKGKDKDNKDENGKEEKEQQITNMAQREREIDKKRKMMKVPALLKQLMQDDRALQSEYIDTETNDKNNSREKRDW